MKFLYRPSVMLRNTLNYVVFVIACALGLCMPSCAKKDNNANAKFIGTYQGNDCSGNALPNLTVTAGPNGSSIILSLTGAIGNCATGIAAEGMVSGDSATFAVQTFNDICGGVLIVSGSGHLDGNVFTVNITGLDSSSASSGPASSIYCFTGTK